MLEPVEQEFLGDLVLTTKDNENITYTISSIDWARKVKEKIPEMDSSGKEIVLKSASYQESCARAIVKRLKKEKLGFQNLLDLANKLHDGIKRRVRSTDRMEVYKELQDLYFDSDQGEALIDGGDLEHANLSELVGLNRVINDGLNLAWKEKVVEPGAQDQPEITDPGRGVLESNFRLVVNNLSSLQQEIRGEANPL